MRKLLIILLFSVAAANMDLYIKYAEYIPDAVNCSKKHNMPPEFTNLDFTKKDFGIELAKYSDELKRVCIAGCIYKTMTPEKLIKSITQGFSGVNSALIKELTENIKHCFQTNNNDDDDCKFTKCLIPVVFDVVIKQMNKLSESV